MIATPEKTARERVNQLRQLVLDAKQSLGMSRVTDVLGESTTNDPFWVQNADLRRALWAAGVYQQVGTGTHPRGCHYRWVSSENPYRVDGTPYLNFEGHWKALATGLKDARRLGLIPAMLDKRNPEPYLAAVPELVPWVDEEDGCGDMSPLIAEALPAMDIISLPGSESDWGNARSDYYAVDQQRPFHLAVWLEKQGAVDLRPLARSYSAEIVEGLGEASDEMIRKCVARINRIDKPTHILYVSDFDPAGRSIPKSAARRIEYFKRTSWLEQLKPDVTLKQVALRPEQVERYRLPTIPVKESERRKDRFETLYGKDAAVELDALVALHPGELERLIEAEFEQYWDQGLLDKFTERNEALREDVRYALEENRPDVEQLYAKGAALYGELRRTVDEVNSKIGKLNGRLRTIRREISDELGDADCREPTGALSQPARDGLLLDTALGYDEQVELYRAHSAGRDGRSKA